LAPALTPMEIWACAMPVSNRKESRINALFCMLKKLSEKV
jgi:hypothetical protein